MKKFISLLLIIALLFSIAITESFASSPEIVSQLADYLYLHENSFYSENASGDINENYFVYTPNAAVTPYLAHGNDVAGAAAVSRVERLEKEAGNTLIAVVNGDYFTTGNGIPVGIEIKDGVIKSSSHLSFPEIGFMDNGTAIIGRSNLQVTMENVSRGIRFDYLNYNKAVSEASGPVVFSADFEDTNRANFNTFNMLVTIVSGTASPNGSIVGIVKDIFSADDKLNLEDGELVLTVPASAFMDVQEKMNASQIGDQIVLNFTMDPAWQNVKQALGGKEVLVENGVAEKYSDNTRAPRTAIGTKANGAVVVYTCDGRDYGGSKGLTLTELGRRMVQLGCTKAINLDGGASTQVHVAYPGESSLKQINEDAGSSLRSCGNYICFKNNAPRTGNVARLYAYPNAISLAAESSIDFNIKACDSAWYPVDTNGLDINYQVTGNLGYVENGQFVSGIDLGEGKILASYGNASVAIDVKVIPDWPEISANYAGGMLIGSIVDPLGEGIPYENIKMTVDGQPYDFIYGNGVLSATFDNPDGMLHHVIITAKNSKGHISRLGLPITLDSYTDENGNGVGISTDPVDVFADVPSSNWAKPYIEYLYRNRIISGNIKNDKLYYNPSAKMTRQEFAKVITAWYGVNVSDYDFLDLSFADNNQIADWAVPYVKASVALGFMSGKSINGVLKFDPNGSITRQEVMTVIGRIMESGYQSSNLAEFSDSSKVANWALPYVKVLVKQNIISGSNGKLLPENPVTREQVAKIIFEIN